jgi:hypothetical protein
LTGLAQLGIRHRISAQRISGMTIFIHHRGAGRLSIITPDGVLTTTTEELQEAFRAARMPFHIDIQRVCPECELLVPISAYTCPTCHGRLP